MHTVDRQWYQARYASVRKAMSMPEALGILGFRPGSQPTPDEVNKAWRQLAFENHPDRGGSPERMVEINVAKDMLLGTGTMGRPNYDRGPGRPNPYEYRRPEPPPPVPGVPFDDALSSANIPTTIDWKVVSTDGIAGAEVPYSYTRLAILYGRSASGQHVVAVLATKVPNSYDKHVQPSWQGLMMVYPATFALKKLPAAIKNALSGWKSVRLPKRFNVWPEGTRLTERTLEHARKGRGLPLADALVGAGVVAQTESERKTMVEIEGVYNAARRTETPPEDRKRRREEDFYDWWVLINGKKFPLAAATVKNLSKALFFYIFQGDEWRSPHLVKNISRAKGSRMFRMDARTALTILADNLTSEPSEVILGVMRALEESEGVYGKNASTFQERLAAMLRKAMSMPEALQVLGFPPDASPTSDEVNKAWRQKAFENHPDRGGDTARMVEINVAKDILQGRSAPSYDRSSPSYPTPSPSPYTRGPFRPEPEPEPVKVTFDEAKAKAGIPADTEWLFVTTPHRSGYSGDESERSYTGWVACGQTDANWVFVTVEHLSERDYYPGSRHPPTNVYRMTVTKLPKKGPPDAATLYKGVLLAWKNFDRMEKRFNSKVLDAEGWRLDDKLPKGGRDMSIKNLLLNKGLTEQAAGTVRKHTIELKLTSRIFGRADTDHKLILIIDGREAPLSDGDTQKLHKLRVEGKPFMNRVFGEYYYGGEERNLTRLRAGKVIMKWMADNLPDLPDWARTALDEAAAQMKSASDFDENVRTASVRVD